MVFLSSIRFFCDYEYVFVELVKKKDRDLVFLAETELSKRIDGVTPSCCHLDANKRNVLPANSRLICDFGLKY